MESQLRKWVPLSRSLSNTNKSSSSSSSSSDGKRARRSESEGEGGGGGGGAEEAAARALLRWTDAMGGHVHVVAALTALAYLRRFAVAVGERDEREVEWSTVALACLYLAGKVEELPPAPRMEGFEAYALDQRGVHVEAMCKIAARDAKSSKTVEKLRDEVVKFETTLLRTLDFDLWVLHPLRPAMHVLEELGADVNTPEARIKAEKACVELYVVSDVPLTQPPALLGAAVALVAAESVSTPSAGRGDALPRRIADIVARANAKANTNTPPGATKAAPDDIAALAIRIKTLLP